MQINRGKAQNFAFTTIYKGITSSTTRKNIFKDCQILKKKEKSRKRPILAVI